MLLQIGPALIAELSNALLLIICGFHHSPGYNLVWERWFSAIILVLSFVGIAHMILMLFFSLLLLLLTCTMTIVVLYLYAPDVIIFYHWGF